MKWTVDQQKAIDARKGTLLVSAAAGSGKTAVLVERVIRRICDKENPCGVENLLIVTFTNAAAAQMKEKIAAAISKKIALNPSDKSLRRQQLMLPCANICTIDSFCINLVRENFHALGISPDFTLIDDGELDILKSKAVNTVVEELYGKNEPDFINLCNLISDNRDDGKLIQAIYTLHKLSQAYPFPEDWLVSLKNDFCNPVAPEESRWGIIIREYLESYVKNALDSIEHCLGLLTEEPELQVKYAPAFESDRITFENLEKALDKPWDEIVEAFNNVAFESFKRTSAGYESELKEICKSVRTEYRDTLKKKITGLLSVSASEHFEDLEHLSPIVAKLIDAVLAFDEELTRLKLEANQANFSDTLHLALKLLFEKDENGYRKTALANELSANYAEILVDEYQDVNMAQDMIFNALSKDENNLFMVGDVKQSIYKFRQAMPEIFLARRDGLEEYETEKENYPARVTLGKNFRSRKGVTEIINFIFAYVMSREAGGLDYDEKERLEAAADYKPSEGADTEVYLFEAEKEEQLSVQARFAADYIEKSVANGLKLADGRNADYKDFCILLRSIKVDSKPFVDEFTRRGIPVSCEAAKGILETPEITFLLSLLKIIDNPVDDIPLTAVMISPVFGFTPDELAAMRTGLKKGSIYACLVNSAENGNSKARAFLEATAEMRTLASTLRTGELVRRLIEDTGYGAIVCAMKDSEKRRANLNLFIDLANKYENTGSRGVSGFIRYVDSAIGNKSNIKCGETKSEAANAVKIMTIHKSKGLEFPVCFVAACEKAYSTLDLKKELIIARSSGVGIKTNYGAFKFDTLPRIAAKLETVKENHSEELRILYVALTRAKERLVMLASAADWSKTLTGIASKIRASERLDPFSVNSFTSYSECILAALLRHPDAHSLRMKAGLSERLVLPCDTKLKAEIISGNYEQEEIFEETIQHEASEEMLLQIKERLEYKYPFEMLNGIVAKRIASKLDSEEIGGEYFASKKPAFTGKGRLTPAQRGTATHRFMQFADYTQARNSVEAELCRLVENGMLTEDEANAVDKKSVGGFFESSLAERILGADKVYKEYSFTASVPLAEMHPEIPADAAKGESIIIEGVVDCAFEENGKLIIVDFKTDRASNGAELAERYKEQLSIYRRCLAEVIGLPVAQTLIYSFRLGEIIAVN